MKLFEPNDYLLVRRSLYASDFRERAPRATFGGVCSGDILTIKENPEKIADGFLIGVLNSPSLWKFIVANASGSITRRIKWKDLANYEFLLPPKDQQAELAELLWAMDEVIEKSIELKSKTEKFYYTKLDSILINKKASWEEGKLDNLASVNKDSLNSKTDPSHEFFYLDIASIEKPKVIGNMDKMSFEEAPSRARRIVENNSIVLSLVRPYLKSFAYVEDGTNIIASTGTGVINNAKLDIRFLFHQFFSKRFENYCENRMTGTNYPAINQTDLKDFPVLYPKRVSDQKEVSIKLDLIEKQIECTDVSIKSSKSLQKSLINQIF
ncbi:MAG: restriction endonuclease subunit S [Balneola sp.]